MKKILVTGGAGFIGHAFIRAGLEKGYQVIVIDKLNYAGDRLRIKDFETKLTFYAVDISQPNSMESIFQNEKPDYLVHFAAETHVDRSIINATPFIHTNIIGTQNLLDLCCKFGIEKYINISTDEVYGELKTAGKFNESDNLNPSSPYSVSKAAADMLGRAYYRTYQVPVITVRPSNTYGPWQFPEKFIPVIIFKALNNEKIPVYGTGQNVREWLYLSDCAEGIFQILERGTPGEIYNLGSGEIKTNLEVVYTILEVLNKQTDLIEFTKDRLGHDLRYTLDTNKIRHELGWYSKITFTEGINQTVRWYSDHLSWVNSKLNFLRNYWSRYQNDW